MKISQLALAFRKFAYHQESARRADDKPDARPETHAPRTESERIASSATTEDTTEISPEAVFRYAALRYDPHHISPDEMQDLVGLLYDGQAISSRDYEILVNGPTRSSDPIAATGPEIQRDAVAAWQDQRVRNTARGDISAVEPDSRALSIFGRLASAAAQHSQRKTSRGAVAGARSNAQFAFFAT